MVPRAGWGDPTTTAHQQEEFLFSIGFESLNFSKGSVSHPHWPTPLLVAMRGSLWKTEKRLSTEKNPSLSFSAVKIVIFLPRNLDTHFTDLISNSNLKQLSILWVTERKKNNAIFSPLDGCLSLTRRRLKQKSLHQNNLPYVFGFFKFVVRRRFLANWGRPWKKLQGLLWSWEELCSEPIAEFCCLMSV